MTSYETSPSDEHPVIPFLTQKRRAWLYRVFTALAPVAVVYGVVDSNEAALWAGVVAAVLGVPASANTTVR